RLGELVDLAPLHQPPALAALDEVTRVVPDAPAVACFDTAFHASLPREAATYALPAELRDRYGIRRFGFHGLSHAYASRRAVELVAPPSPADFRVVTCHLGAGASLAAVRGGRCVDTTMGFTPLEGLVMATRSGSIDPSIVLRVQQRHGLTAAQIEETLNRQSGLLGVSGLSADMRQILALAQTGQPRACL